MRIALRILVIVPLLALPSLAFGAGGRTLAINCYHEQYKPARIVLSCGDAGIQLRKLHWTRWTRTKAVASGEYVQNNCTPDCAEGRLVSRPVRVTLTDPKACPGQSHLGFVQASFSYPDGRPRFSFRRMTLLCP